MAPERNEMTAEREEPLLLRLRGVTKSFPGVRALNQVDLELRRGETLALLGENGAGKSTLIRILAGAHQPDEGTVEIEGRPVDIPNPAAAWRMGISIIHQEFNLLPYLSVAENIFLGHEIARNGVLSLSAEKRRAKEVLRRLGSEIDPSTPCSRLTVAQQQLVEIAKALSLDSKILVMDEPSATLTQAETDRLLEIIRELTKEGIGVIYISHRLEEIFGVADRALILRDGERIDVVETATTSREALIEKMVGRRLDQEFPTRDAGPMGETRLHVQGLTRAPAVNNVSFELRRGEILGLAGLVGSGRTEVARLIFGADQASSGTIELNGRSYAPRNPREAIRKGIGLLTEDRKSQGLILNQQIRHNFGLPNLRKFSRAGIVESKRELNALRTYIDRLPIKIASPNHNASTLSGGNQQKVVLAKWLETDAEVLIFDEPTRGIDVGAKYEIYVLMRELAKRGKSILMISSELPEALAMSDRLLVMRNGRITGEIANPAEATQEEALEYAIQ